MSSCALFVLTPQDDKFLGQRYPTHSQKFLCTYFNFSNTLAFPRYTFIQMAKINGS